MVASASAGAAAGGVDIESAVKEMKRGYDLAVQLHCILLAQKPHPHQPPQPTARSTALHLAEQIVRAFKASLDSLRPPASKLPIVVPSSSIAPPASAKPQPPPVPPPPALLAMPAAPPDNAVAEDAAADSTRNSSIYSLERRKGKDESWKTVTSTPHHDGYQWRKYGEKKIRGTVFPRCYYRCTYLHDQNCQATKQVQQLNSDDPPLFDVTYNRRHTCYSASSAKQNGDCPPPSKDGYSTCINFGAVDVDEDDDDDDVTIVASSTTHSRELDPAVLRQLNQDATKRQRINPPIGTAQQVARPSPSPSGLSTVGSSSSPMQPVSSSREETSTDSALLRHLNQETTEMLRRNSVIAPTPLSVAGPTPLSVVGPVVYSAAGRSPSEHGGTPTSAGPSSSVLASVRSAVHHVPPTSSGRQDLILDPSLMRRVNQEAVKRMRTSSNFGATPSSVVGSISNNIGDRSGASRPRHCASFPPFTFSGPRYERSTSQDGSSIESLFTLPSERPPDLQIANSKSQIQNHMGGMLTTTRVEGSPSLNLMNFNAKRVKRSLSDNGIQSEGSSHLSLTQKSPNTSMLNPNLSKTRRSLSQEQDEIEGVYTLSSMDMLPVKNPPNPNSSRFRSLLRSRSQMEGALSMSPVDKRLFLETSLANATNAANGKGNEIDRNKSEGTPIVSSAERLTDASMANHDSDRGGRIVSHNENGQFSRSSVERSCETNSTSCTESDGDRTLRKSRDQMDSTVSLSSLERLPGSSNVNPNPNEEDVRILENQIETDAALSLSSNRSTQTNLANHEESAVRIELSLSSVERPPTRKAVAKSLSQGHSGMEGILSLSSKGKLADASAIKPDSRSEMASILTLAPVVGSIDGNSKNSNSSTGEKCSSFNEDRMEASLNLSALEVSCNTNMEKPDAHGPEKTVQPSQIKVGLMAEKSSPEMKSENLKLLGKADDRNGSVENHSQTEGGSNMPPMDKSLDTNPSVEHQGQKGGMQRLQSAERSSEPNMRESNPSQMESTSASLKENLPNTVSVQSDSNSGKHQESRLELSFSPKSAMPPAEPVLPPLPPLSAPSLPPPPPLSPSPPPPASSSMPQSSKDIPKSNEEIAQLEATVAELRSKLEYSKEEAVTTKEKVTTLEAEISAIKAATEAWQRIMAEEASRRVAEAVSRFTSSLHAGGSSEASRRTEILFPGAENDDDPAGEVPSLLSQLEKNK